MYVITALVLMQLYFVLYNLLSILSYCTLINYFDIVFVRGTG